MGRARPWGARSRPCARGRMVIMVDDEDRENEGDLVLAAEHATPEAINFLVTHARGLVCLSLEAATARPARRADDGAQQHRTARHRVHGLDRGPATGSIPASRRTIGRAPSGSPAPTMHDPRTSSRRDISSRCAPHPAAFLARARPYRRLDRHPAPGRIEAGGGDLRSDERRWQHGAAARTARLRCAARSADHQYRRAGAPSPGARRVRPAGPDRRAAGHAGAGRQRPPAERVRTAGQLHRLRVFATRATGWSMSPSSRAIRRACRVRWCGCIRSA